MPKLPGSNVVRRPHRKCFAQAFNHIAGSTGYRSPRAVNEAQEPKPRHGLDDIGGPSSFSAT